MKKHTKKKRKLCRLCGKLDLVSRHGLCNDCMVSQVLTVTTQLRQKKGAFYQRWRKRYQEALEHGLVGKPRVQMEGQESKSDQ